MTLSKEILTKVAAPTNFMAHFVIDEFFKGKHHMANETKATSKSAANGLTKDDLFNNFVSCTKSAMDDWELRFKAEGMADRLFVQGRAEQELASAMRKNQAWKTLSDLYEYAINGIDNSDDEQASFLVTEGREVLDLITTFNAQPHARWEEILWMADGRFGLDEGYYIDIRKLALLANVDLRTVRNAISAGDLESFKTEEGVFVENAPARRWLLGRKGFKPTAVRIEEVRPNLDHLQTPGHIAAFLAARRQQLGKAVADAAAAIQGSVEKLEAGVFDMPLDVIGPLANYYQLPRKELLQRVMSIFFPEELDLLQSEGNSATVVSGKPTEKVSRQSSKRSNKGATKLNEEDES